MAEVELKLSVPSGSLEALRKTLADMAGIAAPTPQKLAAVYYDTTSRTLEKSGLTLRVRREDSGYIQTVKSAGKTLVKRGEWNDAVASEAVDLKAPNTAKRIRKLGFNKKIPFKPLFRVDVKRETFLLHTANDTTIEAAIDQGVIRTFGKGAETSPIAELELELKAGDASALYATALKLLPLAPLRLETLSKSARGYALAQGGAQTTAVRGAQAKLDPKMTVDDVIRRAGLQLLAQAVRNGPAILNDDPQGVHQMRVALRRLRSLLIAVKDDMPREAQRWANDHVKRIANALGAARNWDVFLDDMIKPLKEQGAMARGNATFLRAANLARLKAHAQAKEAVTSAHYTESILELMRWFELKAWRTAAHPAGLLNKPVRTAAKQLIKRQFKRARKRSQNFAAMPVPERHEFRIALKNLRYTIELLRSLLDAKKVTTYLKKLKPLQDALGQLNDIRTAQELLGELTRDDSSSAVAMRGGMIVGWYESIAHANEKHLCQQVEKFRNAPGL